MTERADWKSHKPKCRQLGDSLVGGILSEVQDLLKAWRRKHYATLAAAALRALEDGDLLPNVNMLFLMLRRRPTSKSVRAETAFIAGQSGVATIDLLGTSKARELRENLMFANKACKYEGPNAGHVLVMLRCTDTSAEEYVTVPFDRNILAVARKLGKESMLRELNGGDILADFW